MNHRESPHHPARRREALSCLAVLFLAPAGAAALPRPSSPKAHSITPANTTTYLPVVGAPQLRFQPKPYVAEPVQKLPDSSAPVASPGGSTSGGDFIIPKLHGAAEHAAEASPVVAADKSPAPAPSKTPAAIIQDDLRPAVRAEDVLPYFQMPGSARNPSDVTLLMPVPKAAPAPAAIPPSSATYTQTPK